MKKLNLVIILFFLLPIHSIKSQTFLSEDFENGGSQPDGWVQMDIDTTHNGEWTYQDGGYSGNPPTAHSGSYNALFHYPSLENEATMLITPPIDISGTIEPQVSFYHAQRIWFSNNDELRIYYKVAEDSSWVKLDSILGEVYNWTEQVFDLPEKSSTLYIGFEATTKYGLGVCIDDVMVYESAVIPMHVKDMTVSQASDNFVYNGSENNPILTTDIYVYGNSGSIFLNSAVFHSKNIDNSDIELDGVKLYSTETNVFTPEALICPAKNFTGDSVVFDNINIELPNGHTYIWLTYDVDDSATEGNTLDARLMESRINISDTLYPSSNQDPPGERTIFRAIYADDFEEDNPWLFSGEFERDTARGKGGISFGFADPAYAYSGKRIIGTDITGQGSYPGDYEPNLTNREDSAVSPPINCYFYKDIYLRFFRQLNIDYLDRAYIDVSNDDGNTWNKIWESSNSLFTTDNAWKLKELNVYNYIDRDTAVKFRFSIGTTDASRQFSGWNIDDFVITGDLIEKDIALGEVTYPLTSCGLGEEQVSVWIKNTGKNDLSDTIPLSLQIKKGIFLYDSLKTPLSAGDSTLFTFSQTYDFIPGNYNLVMINHFDQDEYSKNDTTWHSFYSLPTYNIPYTQQFETDTNFWLPYGENSSWELGAPDGNTINYAFSGENSWVTSLDTFYNENEASYLESPCFNLYGIDYTLAEFNLWYQMEKGIDGLSFQYSTDGGNTWDTVGHKDERWNWYNSDTISSLDSFYSISHGWTDTSGGWITARHILPEEVKNHSSVKFRFIFANNDTINHYEGIAIDDIVFREPPPDVGVVELIAPDSACELSTSEEVIVALKNFGADTLESGFQIPVGLILNNEYLFTDTIELAEDLIAKDTMHYTFNEHVDVWDAGDYEFKAFTDLQADENLFSEGSNTDTNTTVITVYGMPNYTLGPDIGTTQPDTVVLDAGAGYVSYLWNDLSTGRYFNVPSAGKYSVVVTNDYACTAEDTILVASSYMDLGVTDLLNIESGCYNSSSIYPEIEIKNYSLDTLFTGDTVFIGYELNEEVIDADSLILTENFYPDSTILHSFDEDINMSSFMDYEFRFYTAMQLDIKRDNDTLYTTKNTWGPPPLDLGEDIYTTMADTVALAADTGYASYLWQDGSTNDTLLVSYPATANYSVTVEDIHSCQNSDTITIYTYDIAMQSVDSPVSSCELTDEEYINTTIKNFSQDTLSIGTPLLAYYTINDTAYTQDSITLSQVLYPDSIMHYTFNDYRDFSLPSIYEIQAGIYLQNDADTLNDTTVYSFEVFGLPTANIGPDTIFTTQADTIIFTPGAGFTDYLWQDSSVNDTFYVNYPATATYHVLITDENSCQDRDTSVIITYDVGIQNINAPLSSCELTNEEYIDVDVINLSADTLLPGNELTISYSLDDTIVSSDNVVLSQIIYPDSILNHIFSQPVDLSVVNDYELEISANLENDADPSNDTLLHTISVYGYPSIDLGPDTLYTTQADTVVLAPGNGYDSYLWQDSTTNDSLFINFPGSATYFVSVENEHNCQSNDTIHIITTDLAINNVNSPINTCGTIGTTQVITEIINLSADTLFTGTQFEAFYDLNDTLFTSDIITLAENLYPDSSIQHTFSEDFEITEYDAYQLDVGVDINNDADTLNDIMNYNFEMYTVPTVDIGPDTLFTTQPDTVALTTSTSFDSYEWQDGSINDTFYVSYPATATYSVLATDAYSCSNSDTITIVSFDIGVQNIHSPESNCELSATETIQYEFANTSEDTIPAGTSLQLYYTLNDTISSQENINLPATLYPDSVFQYTFSQTANFSSIGIYSLKTGAVFALDADSLNNELTKNIEVYGYPDVNLGPDTIFTTMPDTVILTPGAGYASYNWQDGSTNDTLFVTYPGSATYFVEVTDSNTCPGSDTVRIITKDLSINDIVSPVSSCELTGSEVVSIKIRNNSADTLFAGASLQAAYTLDGANSQQENIVLASNLYPDSTFEHSFSQTIDLSSIGVYNLETTVLYSWDADTTNNSYNKDIEVFGFPDVELGYDTIFTTMPDTVILTPGTGYASYNWQDNSTNDTLFVTYPGSANYYVEVTDSNTCPDSDTVRIIAKDLIINDIVSPVSSCELTDSEAVSIKILNNSADTLFAGASIQAAYTLDGTNSQQENIVLTSNLYPDSTFEHSFSQTVDLSSTGIYNLETRVAYLWDADTTNNSYSKDIEVFGFPDVELGYDTIFTTMPDTVILTPGAGYASYNWQDGSTNDTLFVTYPGSATYFVEVTDSNTCPGSDTVRIITKDLSIDDIVSPVSSCELTASEVVSIKIRNNSADTLFAGASLQAAYTLDGANSQQEDIVLASNLYPDSTFEHSFSQTIDLSSTGIYNLQTRVAYLWDADTTNNSYSKDIEVFGFPGVEIGYDTIFTTMPDTVILTPGAGYASYNWQDGSTNDTLFVTYPGSATYFVEVTDSNTCPGSDTVRIITKDLSINDIASPVSSCELTASEVVSIKIRNNSADTLFAGASLQAAYTLDGANSQQENIVLASNLYPDSTFEHSFSQTVDLSSTGIYNLETRVAYLWDADTTNNSYSKDIEVFGFPDVELGPDTIITAQPDTIVLNPGSGYSSYTWQDGSTAQTYTPSGNYSAWYKVIVTNNGGCPGSDSIFIYINDIAVSAITSPVPGCELSNEETVTLELMNNGPDTLKEQKEIVLSLEVNDSGLITDTLVISNDVLPGDVASFSFDESFDMSDIGSYTIEVFKHDQDVNGFNDTLYVTVFHYGYPSVDIGPDSIITSQPDTILLDAGQGFATYQWQDGSSSQTYDVEDFGMYWVIVTDNNGCSASDTTIVKLAEGIKELASKGIKVKIYPNPVKNILNVQIQNHKQPTNTEMQLFNNASYRVWKKDVFVEKKHEVQIDFGSFSKGVYYLRISGKEFNTIIEVVK